MIRVENLTVQAGGFRIEGISFEIPTGAHGVLMGRTGCGKTTILEAICGLRRVTAGRITLMETEVTSLPPGRRGVGFVPQEGTLFPHQTVRQQLAFGPRVQGWSPDTTRKRVAELAESLGIAALLDRRPDGLSGGERQRVALGRALAVRPQVICLDEPLSALDEETHGEMTELIRTIVKQHGMTALHITHSRREARMIADHLFVLENGKVTVAS